MHFRRFNVILNAYDITNVLVDGIRSPIVRVKNFFQQVELFRRANSPSALFMHTLNSIAVGSKRRFCSMDLKALSPVQ